MGKMARFAVFLLDRLMDDSGLVAGDLFRVALGASPAYSFRGALRRGGPATGREPQDDKAEPQQGSRQSSFHHAPPSSF